MDRHRLPRWPKLMDGFGRVRSSIFYLYDMFSMWGRKRNKIRTGRQFFLSFSLVVLCHGNLGRTIPVGFVLTKEPLQVFPTGVPDIPAGHRR